MSNKAKVRLFSETKFKKKLTEISKSLGNQYRGCKYKMTKQLYKKARNEKRRK